MGFWLAAPFCHGISRAQGSDTAQSRKIEFLNADEAYFDENASPRVLRIRGRVVLRHQDVMVFCDSAWRYMDVNAFTGFGRVHLQQGDSLDAYGDTLRYDGDGRLAYLAGRVRVQDRGTRLQAPRLTYNLNTRTAWYADSAITQSGRSRISSRQGYYEARRRRMSFKGNVRIHNPEYTILSDTVHYDLDREISYFHGPTTILGDSLEIRCTYGWHDSRNEINSFSGGAVVIHKTRELRGDSLFYDRQKGYGRARGSVMLRDTAEKAVVYGRMAESFEDRGYSYVTDSLTLVMAAEDDSLFLSSDTLHVWDDPVCDKILVAAHGVRFFLRDLQGVCDSLVYITADSLMQLYRKPVLWNEQNQLSAQFISVVLQRGRISRFDLYEQSFIVSQEDSSRFNQLSSILMTGHFRDNALDKVEARGVAVSVYYPREDSGDFAGANKARGSDIVIWLRDKKVQRIRFTDNPSGTLYPVDKIPPEEARLQGFRWLPELRPKNRSDIYKSR
ncbi:MAG: hypothetical protein NZM15_10145 [Flavobacteriales bacterium]|nr:hypothetical protein [Flavobacteriales bacterium]MDW8433045.1 OstA-like protein [Flavobacteriales bacterium]